MRTIFTLLTQAYVLAIHQDSTQSLFRTFPIITMLFMTDLSYMMSLHCHQTLCHVDMPVVTSYASAYGDMRGEIGPVRTIQC